MSGTAGPLERGVRVEPSGSESLHLRTLLLDFTGTLSKDGQLRDGVSERLCLLHKRLDTQPQFVAAPLPARCAAAPWC